MSKMKDRYTEEYTLEQQYDILKQLLGDNETIATTIPAWSGYSMHFIKAKDSNDIHQALENTLHTLLDDFRNPEKFGFQVGEYEEETNIYIDLGYYVCDICDIF